MHELQQSNKESTQIVDGREIEIDAKWEKDSRAFSIFNSVVEGSKDLPALLPISALLMLAWIVEIERFGAFGLTLIVGAITLLGGLSMFASRPK